MYIYAVSCQVYRQLMSLALLSKEHDEAVFRSIRQAEISSQMASVFEYMEETGITVECGRQGIGPCTI